MSSDGIATALQDSASSLMAANNSYQEAVALIASANKVVQDPNSVGSALRTISLRLRGTSTKELEDAGEDTTGAVTSKSKLRSKIKALSGIDILTDTGAYKSTYEILLEISKVWEDMSDVDQAALLEIIAGKTRSNTAAAILSNTTDLENAYVDALNAEGSALEENEKYLDSIQGRLDLFNNAIQTMWQNTLDSDIIKTVVNLGTELIKIVDTLGLIPSILLAILTYKSLVAAVKFFNIKDLATYIGLMWTAKDVTELQGLEVDKLSLKQKLLNSELVKAAIARAGLTAEEVAGLTTTQLLTLGLKGLAAGFKNLWIAIGPVGWAIVGITTALTAGIVVYNAVHKTTEELGEELGNLRSELSDTQSEIESLNSELETTREKIAELEALPSLSLTDQDELKNLKQQNSELERRLQIQEALAQSTKSKIASTSEEYIDSAWNSDGLDKTYFVDSNGVISKDKWYTNGVDTKDALKDAMSKYAQQKQKVGNYKKLIANWDSNAKVQDNFGQPFYYAELRNIDDAKDGLEKAEDKLKEIGDGINKVFADENFKNLTYGMSDEIDSFLDELYAYQLKWQEVQGLYVKSDAISGIFDSTSTEEIQNLGKELRAIADNDILTDEQKNKQIQYRINCIDKTNEAYGRLNTTMKTVGVTAEDIADYFVLETGEFDSNTIEGITAQYAKALTVMKQVKNSDKSGDFSIDGEQYNWDDFFSVDDEGKFEARVDKFSEILKGMDDDCRNTFMSLTESVKNGSLSWEQAMKSFEHSGNIAGLKVIEAQIIELNNTEFSNISDEISGVIDTFKELSSALDDVATSVDLLNTAQTQMNNSGRISVKTALEIMQSTDQWNEILSIENGNIKLVGNATEVLVENKLALIKANLQNALSTVTEQLAMVDSQNVSEDLATTMEESTNQAVRKLAGSMAYLTKMMEAYTRIANGENVSIDDYILAAQEAQSKVEEDLNWKVNSANKIGTTELEKRKEEIEAQLEMLNGIDTYSEFKNNYDYDKTPGDKYDSTSGALEALQKKYERQITNLENQQTYLENEIERNEAVNKGSSISYYKEQIALEDKKLDLLEQEREALLKLKMNDDVADALWEVEHAIQESTIAAINFGKAMHDAQKEAIDSISEAYDAMETISSNRMQNLDLQKESLELDGKFASEGLYNQMIDLAQGDVTRNEQKLQDLLWAIDEYRNMENPFEKGTDEYNGFEADRDKNIVDLHAQAAETKNSIIEGTNEVKQLREDMKDTYIEAWDSISEAFDNIGSFLQNQMDFIDAYEERLNTLNINIPDEVYEQKIDVQKEIVSNLNNELAEDKKLLSEYASKYGTSDERYIEKLKEVTEKESQLYQEETKRIEYEQQMFDNQIDRFNQVIDRINDATQRLQNISDLIGDKDVATENGEWTDEGLTRLGMAYQQMAYYKRSAEEVAKKMEDVEESYKRGEISEKKYYETMQELSDQQWDAIEAYKGQKDAIVDLNEARIDMIEDGINKEIDAYSELIDLKKKSLDAERDLYNFRKDIQKQTKDIASLERRIASMSGSSDAATIAERTKLEAELRESRDSLNDTYYDHAMSSKADAYDDEMEAFEKSKTDYLENLRESIKDTDKVIEQTYQNVLTNGQTVLETLTNLSNEYGFYIDEYLTSPWENAQNESLDFEMSAISHIDNIYNKVGSITSTLTANITQPWKDGKRDLLSFSEEVTKQLDKVLENAKINQKGILNTTIEFVGNMKGKIDLIPTYADAAAQRMLQTAKQNVKDINAEYAKITYPSYTGDSDTVIKNPSPSPTPTKQTAKMVKDGYIDVSSVLTFSSGSKDKIEEIDGVKYAYDSDNNCYYKFSNGVLVSSSSRHSTYRFDKPTTIYRKKYAKGTLGTKKDQWAITDEPQFGDELTMYATPEGKLSYMRVGSTVVPHDLTKELIDIGKIGVDGLTNMPNFNSGINLMSNFISKPEIKLDIENFLRCDNVSHDTLPELKKFVNEQMNNLVKQLNYGLKRAGAK